MVCNGGVSSPPGPRPTSASTSYSQMEAWTSRRSGVVVSNPTSVTDTNDPSSSQLSSVAAAPRCSPSFDVQRIFDKHPTPKTEVIMQWLIKGRRFHTRLTPPGPSWLNLVKPWFHRADRHTTSALRTHCTSEPRKPRPLFAKNPPDTRPSKSIVTMSKSESNSELWIDRHTLVPTKDTPFERIRCKAAHFLTKAYVVSYPKSGRTWLRMLLATYFARRYGVSLTPEITDQWRQNIRIPRIRFVHLGAGFRGGREYQFDFSLYDRKRIIYLTRNPRDICVSYFYHVTTRWEKVPSGLEDISEFLRDEDLGLPRLIGYMNLMSKELLDLPNVIKTSYEELHEDTPGELARALEFLGVTGVLRDDVLEAVEQCRFDRMQAMERKGLIDHDAMQPGDPEDVRTYKVREGKVGGYRKHLSESDIEFVESYISEHLDDSYGEYLQPPPSTD